MMRGDIFLPDLSGAFTSEEFQRMIKKMLPVRPDYGLKQKQAIKMARRILDKHQGGNKMKICLDTLPDESKIVSVADVADRLVDDSFYWRGIQSGAKNIQRNNTVSLKHYRRHI